MRGLYGHHGYPPVVSPGASPQIDASFPADITGESLARAAVYIRSAFEDAGLYVKEQAYQYCGQRVLNGATAYSGRSSWKWSATLLPASTTHLWFAGPVTRPEATSSA